MRSESIKLTAGALTLRRFTAAELARFTGVTENTAESWIGRNKKFLDVVGHMRKVGRGRPASIRLINSSGAAHFQAELEQFPKWEVQEELVGAFEHVDVKAAVDDIEELLSHLNPLDPQERTQRLMKALTDDVGKLRRQIGRLEQARVAIPQPEKDRLAAVETRVRLAVTQIERQAARAEDVAELATRIGERERTEVLASHKALPLPLLVSEVVEVLKSAAMGRLLERSLLADKRNSNIWVLAILAALGMLDKFFLPDEPRRLISSVAQSITPERYLEAMDSVIPQLSPQEIPATMLLVSSGIHRHDRLAADPRLQELMNRQRTVWSSVPATIAAWAKLSVPDININNVASSTPWGSSGLRMDSFNCLPPDHSMRDLDSEARLVVAAVHKTEKDATNFEHGLVPFVRGLLEPKHDHEVFVSRFVSRVG